MRDFLVFVAILAAIFFGIGEWQGWYLGVPGQTPVFVYKKDAAAFATRRTLTRNDLPYRVSGDLRRGRVTVEGYYQQAASFQTGAAASPEQLVFRETFTAGQAVDLAGQMRRGTGVYRLRLVFEDATGLFRVELPKSSEL